MSAYTLLLPIIIGIACTAFYALLPIKPTLLGKDGSIASALSFISTLPGFYFAGLAAVATFGAPSMDVEMPAPAPELDVRIQGTKTTVKLTRRQFASYLFAYLVFLSFLLCILMLALNLAFPSLDMLHKHMITLSFGTQAWLLGKIFAVAVMAVILGSLISSTLQGVFFLTEKIHQP